MRGSPDGRRQETATDIGLSVTAKQPPASLVEELKTGLGSALGSELVAVYLYGSSVSGGFDEDVSDIDLLVVTAQDLNEMDQGRIEALHARIVERHPEWDDRLELVYVGRETLAHFRAGGTIGVISPGEPFHIRDGIELWLQNFYLVRETGMTLTGPMPSATVPEISRCPRVRRADDVSGVPHGAVEPSVLETGRRGMDPSVDAGMDVADRGGGEMPTVAWAGWLRR